MSKSIHYGETLDILNAYRSSRSIKKAFIESNNITDFSRLMYMAQKVNNQQMSEIYQTSIRITELVEESAKKLRFLYIDGETFYKVLYYRYLSKEVYNEEQIIDKLAHDKICSTKGKYYALRNKAQALICALMWNEKSDAKTLLQIKLPGDTNER